MAELTTDSPVRALEPANDPSFESVWDEIVWRGLVHVSTDQEALRALLGRLDAAEQIPQLEVASGDDEVAVLVRHLQPLSAQDREALAAAPHQGHPVADREPEGDVRGDREVGEERRGLEDEPDVAAARGEPRHVLVIEPDPPEGRIEWVEIQAVYSLRTMRLPWRDLQNDTVWRQGWL